jgi:hypothetical protein
MVDPAAGSGWTFGIITGGAAGDAVAAVIASIVAQGIPAYEIIVMGVSEDRDDGPVRYRRFDDAGAGAAAFPISRKKNAIVRMARHERLCLIHDYVALDPGWYAGFRRFEAEHPDWRVVVCRVENQDGTRYLDWFSSCHPATAFDWARVPPRPVRMRLVWLPDGIAAPGYQFVPGYAWAVRRAVMLEHPLDERLRWNEAEDAEWSGRVCRSHALLHNPRSAFRFLKLKPGPCHPADPCHGRFVENTRTLARLAERGQLLNPAWRLMIGPHEFVRRLYARLKGQRYVRAAMR